MKIDSKTKISVLLICIALLLSITGCGGSSKDTKPSDAGSKAKKVVNVGIMNAPSAFNPLEWSDYAQNVFTAILFKPLMELDDDLTYAPGLADSIETKDNKVFVVTLNQKAKWTDGKSVTADDVIFTLKMISNPKVTASVASSFNVLEGLDENGKNVAGTSEIAGVKKIDDHTLTLTTKTPMDLTLFKEGVGTKLKTIPQHVVKDIAPDKFSQSPFVQKPEVTNGPFKLVTYQKGQYVQFAANKDYFRGVPKLDEVYFKIMPGANITAQLQSGEIDMNDASLGTIPIEDTDKVKSMPNIIADTKGMSTGIQTLMINMNTVTDVRVRKAISHAINRKLIIDNLVKGDGEAIELPYLSSSPFINKKLPLSSYNPEKAKQLLQEAGWDTNRTLNFDVPSGNKVREQAADIIVDNLKNIGMKVQIQKYDFVTSMAKAKKGEFDLYILGLTVYPTTPDLSHILKTGMSLNLSKYSNQEMDDLLVAGKSTVDPVKRQEIYDKVQELFMRDMPSPGVFAPNNLKAVSKRVIVGRPKTFGTYITLHDWDVKN